MKARLIFHALAILALTAMVVFAQEPAGRSTKSAQRAAAPANSQDKDRFSDGEARRHSDAMTENARTEEPGGETNQTVSPRVTPHRAPSSTKNSAHSPESLGTADSAGSTSLDVATDQNGKTSGASPLFVDKEQIKQDSGRQTGPKPKASDSGPKPHPDTGSLTN